MEIAKEGGIQPGLFGLRGGEGADTVRPNGLDGAHAENAKKVNSMEGVDFIKLLLAQIKNQDPTNPEANDPNKMMEQFVALNSLQELRSISGHLSTLKEFRGLALGGLVGSSVMTSVNADFFWGEKPIDGLVSLSQKGEAILILTGPDEVDRRIDLGTHPAGSTPFTLDLKELGCLKGHYAIRAESRTGEPLKVELGGVLEGVNIANAGGAIVHITGLGAQPAERITRFMGREKNNLKPNA